MGRPESTGNESPKEDPGRIVVKLFRGDELGHEFIPLGPFDRFAAEVSGAPGDLIDRLEAEVEIELRPGIYQFPLTDTEPFLAEVAEGCTLRASISAGRPEGEEAEKEEAEKEEAEKEEAEKEEAEKEEAEKEEEAAGGRAVVNSVEIEFDPPITLSNVWPVLAALPSLFEDNTVRAIKGQMERIRTSDAAADLQRLGQEWMTRFEEGFKSMAPAGSPIDQGLRQFGAVVREGALRLRQKIKEGAEVLKDELVHSSDRLPMVELAHASARPVKRGDGWQLQLSFSGQAGYPGKVTQRFNQVTLPHTILPAPHGLLADLLTDQPLATATLKLDRISHQAMLREAVRMAGTLRGSFEVEGSLPGTSVEMPMPDLGRMTAEVRRSERLSIKGKFDGTVEDDEVLLKSEGLEVAQGEHRLTAGGRVTVRRRTGAGTRTREASDHPPAAAVRCVDAAFEQTWPYRELLLEAAVAIHPGSSIEGFKMRADLHHPLAKGGNRLLLEASSVELDGQVLLRTGDVPWALLFEDTAVTFSSDFALDPDSEIDDGVTRFKPELRNGRIVGRVFGTDQGGVELLTEGKCELEFHSLTLVEPFPELGVEDSELTASAGGTAGFAVRARMDPPRDGVFTVDFGKTAGELSLERTRVELGGRSLTLPAGSTFTAEVTRGDFASTALGRSTVRLGWDLQGKSPVLEAPGHSVEIFVEDLRQGSIEMHLSKVGGLSVTGRTGGLYDARFFNALVNPGTEPDRWMEILNDDEAMDKVLSSLRVFNEEACELAEHVRNFAKKARTVLTEEGIEKPRDLIPGPSMARVISKLICGTAELEDRVYPLVKQVTDGNGLNVPEVKRLLSEHLPDHDYEFELDRGLRWLARVLAPTDPVPPMTPEKETPLAERPDYRARFAHLPSADEIYAAVDSDEPLPAGFSARVAQVAPYLALEQLDHLVRCNRNDWVDSDLARIKAVRALKERVRLISESYGGIAFLPQAWAVSFFLGEAVRERPTVEEAGEPGKVSDEPYTLADTLLGPEEAAVLLQSGLASFWKGPPVQINQRLLLDLIRRNPPSFTTEVLAELSRGSTRALAGVLYALLQLHQDRVHEPLDVAELLSERLNLSIPRLDDYLAGGRLARESHFEALARTAEQIMDLAEPYLALKEHLQVHRHPVILPVEVPPDQRKLEALAQEAVKEADREGGLCTFPKNEKEKEPDLRKSAVDAYEKAFETCRALLKADPHAFHRDWYKAFWARNHEALVVLSVVRNHQEDIDDVRYWLKTRLGGDPPSDEQGLTDAVIDALYFFEEDRERLKADPLVRLLIDPPPGRYDFTVISCMGVITEGERGTELMDAYRRLDERRGVAVIRADTQTARTLEFNAARAEEAVRKARTPWGYIGYSQGCANGLQTESRLLGGTPEQQELAARLRCRNLLFSSANGSAHGTCGDWKFLRAMSDGDRFLKHYQAIFSKPAIRFGLRNISLLLDSKPFVHSMGGVESLSHDGVRALARDGQFKSDAPTSIIRGIVETETLPESLEMLSNVLTKQLESTDHDTQVTIGEAVGHPVWVLSPQAEVLRRCDMGALVQCTHHWSPLKYATDFVTTERDRKQAIYDFPKDRHVFPWIEVNARFGVIDRIPETRK